MKKIYIQFLILATIVFNVDLTMASEAQRERAYNLLLNIDGPALVTIMTEIGWDASSIAAGVVAIGSGGGGPIAATIMSTVDGGGAAADSAAAIARILAQRNFIVTLNGNGVVPTNINAALLIEQGLLITIGPKVGATSNTLFDINAALGAAPLTDLNAKIGSISLSLGAAIIDLQGLIGTTNLETIKTDLEGISGSATLDIATGITDIKTLIGLTNLSTLKNSVGQQYNGNAFNFTDLLQGALAMESAIGVGLGANLVTEIGRVEVGATVLKTAVDDEILAMRNLNDGAVAAEGSISSAIGTGQTKVGTGPNTQPCYPNT